VKTEKIYDYSLRYLMLLIGLFIMAFGVSLSTRANLGTSPIASVPYVLSMVLPWTMGEITATMQILFVLIQILLLRENYEWIQLLQIGVAVVFGYFTDMTLAIVSGIKTNYYLLQWLLCLLSLFFVGFGIFLEVKSDVVIPPGEGLVRVIAQIMKKEFGKIKIPFDCTLVTISIIISLCSFHSLKGVREGTIAAAILVGAIIRLCNRKLRFIDIILGNDGSDVKVSE
jgi:uncharacterized protein